jgi:hypothetical protein
MKTNLLPFVFLPGAALIGFIVGGWDGLQWAFAVWLGIVALGTAAHLVRRFGARPPRGGHRSHAPNQAHTAGAPRAWT